MPDAGSRAMTLGNVALAAAVACPVDGEADGAIAAIQRLLDRVIHPLTVATHIELEEFGIVGRPADLFQSWGADRAQHMDDAGARRRTGRRHAALGDDVLHRADRCQDDRQLELLAQQRRAGIDMLDIAQHARPEGETVERPAILIEGRLRFRAAHQVIPGPRRKPALGHGQQLKQRIDLTDIGHAKVL